MTAPFPTGSVGPDLTDTSALQGATPMILALPKGRILSECGPLLARAGIVPAPDYADEDSRRLRFPTDDPLLDVVRVRPFDVATFVAFGAAHIGICGADVLMEFDYPEVYARSTWASANAGSRSRNRWRPPEQTIRRGGRRCGWPRNTRISPAGIMPAAASTPRSCTWPARWNSPRGWGCAA